MITIRELVKNSLRMRPDRIVVGEVRGGEALDMLQAMNTGHDGSLTTVHANTPRDSLSRLETMVLMAGIDLPVRAIREQVAGALDLVIQQARLKDGTRKITAISEVVGIEGDVITLQDLFTFDYSAGRDENGRFLGRLKPTGLRPSFTQDLADLGIVLPHDPLLARPGPGMTSYPPLLLVGAGTLFVGFFAFVLALAAPTMRRRGASRAATIEQYIGLAPHADEPEARAGGLAEEIVAFGDRVMRDRDSTPRLRRQAPAGRPAAAPRRVVGAARRLRRRRRRRRPRPARRPGPAAGSPARRVLGLLGPALVLRLLVRRRVKAFERLLPEVLMLVASSLATGFSLLQALDGVARDAAEPAAKEFGRALAETRLGTDVEVALQSMAKRMESRNMEWTAMAIQIQRTVGGNLAETLRTTAATLREREMLKRQVIALSAEGKMSAYILVALPFGIFLFMLRVNYDYVALLWTRPLGLLMLALGGVSLGIGIAWMRSIVNLKV